MQYDAGMTYCCCLDSGIKALLTGIEIGVKLKPPLLVSILIRHHLVSIVCSGFPLLVVCIQLIMPTPKYHILHLSRIHILQVPTAMQDIIRRPNGIICTFYFIPFFFWVVDVYLRASLPPVDIWYTTR